MADVLKWIQELVGHTPGIVVVGSAVVGLLGFTSYLWSRPKPLSFGLDYDNQSFILQGGVRASRWTGQTGKLIEYLYDDAKTVYECFLRGRRITGDGKCLGTRSGPNREYEWMSYNQVFDKIQAFGSGLSQLGLNPGQKSILGIFAKNIPEWTIADMSCQMFSRISVALYETLGMDAVTYAINLCEISTIVCDTVQRAAALLNKATSIPSLKVIVLVEDITKELQDVAEAAGVTLVRFSDVEEMGKKDLQNPVTFQDLTPDDCHLSYLPLAHVYERANLVALLCHGSHVGYFSGDIKLLIDDLQALKPTYFPTVPRLLNKIRDKVISSAESSKVKSFFLNWALRSKLAEVNRGIIRRNSIWDKLIFGKVQELLGGRVKIVITGSAPLSQDVNNFIRCAFGCQVIEGYGQSECTTVITLQSPGDPVPGHVGGPIACNYVKLIDVAEMEYYAKDGIGEGEYIAPEKLETIYSHSKYVAQCFVDGNSLRSYCVAVVVPDPDVAQVWANNNNCPADIKQLCNNKNLKDTILKDMLDVGRKAELKGFEQVLDICLEPDSFSVESGLLTPTFKNRRPQLRKHFADKVAAIYAKFAE
ncbi:hypothetical protein C0Q70_00794 [Pomacea canaliculata]|uniref:long-chain-fatty-acid--CoA ligase n=1 Tax=Pomacea canaliculata TaxID=400727 RepID=A0A2T7PXN0_POMCA|nr:hypothetical protein C0Q70_00794 [Pomacea canaliculata]